LQFHTCSFDNENKRTLVAISFTAKVVYSLGLTKCELSYRTRKECGPGV